MPRNSGTTGSLIWLGWILVALGITSVLLGVFTSIFTWSFVKYIGCSIWVGVFVLITGVIGVKSGKLPENNCWAIAFMVLSIISILMTMVQWIFSSIGISVEGYWEPFDYYYYGYNDIKPYYSQAASATLHSLTLIVGLAEMVVAFSASIACCCHLCNRTTPQQTLHVMTYPGQPGQITVLPNGQVIQHQYLSSAQPAAVFSSTTTTGTPVTQTAALPYVVPQQPVYPAQQYPVQPPPGQHYPVQQPPGQQYPPVQQHPPYTTAQPQPPPLYEEISTPSAPPSTNPY